MPRSEIIQQDACRFRISPWRGDRSVTMLTPLPDAQPSALAVRRTLERLAERGSRQVLTSAMAGAAHGPFIEAGFSVHEPLRLLRHSLDAVPPAAPTRIRRGRWRDVRTVLRIDAAAFEPFWRLDRAGFFDARTATPSHQFRVALDRGPVGYAITGRAGATCYVQRLAVDPQHHGRGIGSALVVDALRWAARHRCEAVLVNTQQHNAAALGLYEHLGFSLEPTGLAVLAWDLS